MRNGKWRGFERTVPLSQVVKKATTKTVVQMFGVGVEFIYSVVVVIVPSVILSGLTITERNV